MRHGQLELKEFVLSQISAAKDAGLSMLLSKLFKGIKLSAAFPFVLLMRLLQPVLKIRIIQLRYERIGHAAIEPELYLSRRDVGIVEKSDVEIFYPFSFYDAPIANHQLDKMWRRTVTVFPAAKWVDLANKLLPGGDCHSYSFGEPRDWDVDCVFARTPTHLAFTPEEVQYGWENLRQLGVPDGAPFVCFLARDSAYLATHQPSEATYNAIMDFRDSDIDNYVPAVIKLAGLGYYTLRMGAAVAKPLAVAHPRVIDYASTSRSDFMDIFLCAYCSFFLGDPTGMTALAMALRRPVAHCNTVPPEHAPTWGAQDLFIFKKYWSREEGKYLTLSEVLDASSLYWPHVEECPGRRFDLRDNSPEEIEALAVEMHDRLSGIWRDSDEDEERRRRFMKIFEDKFKIRRKIVARPGAQFLRTNREWTL